MSVSQDELLARFRLFLEENHTAEEQDSAPTVDLFSLFGELTGLKNEVRIESRQLKAALDEFRAGFTALDAANQRLATQLEQEKAQQERIAAMALKPVILGLIDLHDRMSAGLLAVTNPPRPSSFLAFFCRRQPAATLTAISEGQAMTLRKLEDILLSCGVRPMTALGRPFDPQTMRAVSAGWQPTLPEGVVSEELRTGFQQGDTVLRPADVKVNKQQR